MDLQPKYTFQRPDRLKTVVENDMVLYETESGLENWWISTNWEFRGVPHFQGVGPGVLYWWSYFFFFASRWKEHTPPPPRIPSLGCDLSSLLLHFLTEENSSPRSMPDFWLFGDIKLTDHQKVLLDVPEGAKDKFGFPRKPPAATREKTLLWDNGVIPYEFDCSLRKWFRNYRTASTRTFLSYGVHLNIWCSLERLTFVDSITPLLSAIAQW